MSLSWPKTELGELIDTLKGCAFKSKDYVFLGIPIVRVTDFTEDSISENNLVYLPESLAEEYSAYKLQHNNVVIQTVGSWQYNPASVVGKVVRVPRKLSSSLLNQNAVKLIPNQNIDEKFLYYRLKDDTFKAHVLGCAQGAANQASITLSTIKRFKFFLPPLEVQQKIAAILSAYDDLIENNLKRIKLLEEMAQITYEEWFVRLKFPGHETTPMDSETGLPTGWKRILLEHACDVSGGGTPSTEIDEYWNGGDISWFSPTDLSKNNSLVLLDSSQKITQKGLQKSSAKLMQPNSFMMTSRATIGLFGLIDKPFCTNQGFINVTPKSNFHKHFLLFNFKLRVPEFLNYASGATFLELSKSKFKKLKIDWPTNDLLEKWDEVSTPIIQELTNLSKQNQLLKEARDILLPRLMTGMIDLDSIQFPGSLPIPGAHLFAKY